MVSYPKVSSFFNCVILLLVLKFVFPISFILWYVLVQDVFQDVFLFITCQQIYLKPFPRENKTVSVRARQFTKTSSISVCTYSKAVWFPCNTNLPSSSPSRPLLFLILFLFDFRRKWRVRTTELRNVLHLQTLNIFFFQASR